MMPLCSSARRALRCFFTMLIPSTVIRPVLVYTRRILPSFPLSSPRMTRTVSPRVTGILKRSTLIWWRFEFFGFGRSVLRYFRIRMSDDLRRQRNDLHVLLVAELAGHRTEDARRARLALIVDDHHGVLVEADVAAVLPPRLLHRAHDHRAGDFRLLHRTVRQRILDRDDHEIAEPGIAPPRAAKHADHERAFGARIVRHLDDGFLLNHGSSLLACALDDLDHAPPLVLRQRAGLHDAHSVPGLGRVLLVVRFHPLRAGDHLPVDRMRHAAFDRHDHGLLHLVAHHDPRARLARVPRVARVRGRACLLVRRHVSHGCSWAWSVPPNGARADACWSGASSS